MGHTPRCMEVRGVIKTIALPNFKAQKPFAGGKDIEVHAQIRRRSALVVFCHPYEDPNVQYRQLEAMGLLYIYDSDGQVLRVTIGQEPQRILLPRQCTLVTCTSARGGMAWLEDPKTLGPIGND
jgi:hypothetical protein